MLNDYVFLSVFLSMLGISLVLDSFEEPVSASLNVGNGMVMLQLRCLHLGTSLSPARVGGGGVVVVRAGWWCNVGDTFPGHEQRKLYKHFCVFNPSINSHFGQAVSVHKSEARS